MPTRASAPGAAATGGGEWGWPWVLALIATVVLVYALVVMHGQAQDVNEERVLPALTPAIEGLRDLGSALTGRMMAHGHVVGWIVTATSALIAAVGLVIGRRRALPLLLLGAAFSLAAWGQVVLLEDRTALGSWLYAAGFACAIGLGIWCPIKRLDGFPALPELPRRRRSIEPSRRCGDLAAAPQAPAWKPRWAREWVLVLGLAVGALLSRAWALTELSDFMDLELISYMIQSRTLHGIAGFMNHSFLSTNAGAAQLFPQWAVFNIFGTSIFTLRMTSVLWGIAGTLLMYWLVRRIAGVGPAIVSALLFICAPDQLFWGRSENSYFAPVATCALITVHLGLWMVQRLSFPAVLMVTLWTPFCRYFYSAAIVMVTYPWLVAGHALLFLRGAWRRMWYVLPVLGVGLAMWIFSLTALKAWLNDGQWRFVDPASLYGGAVWTKQGQFAQASLPELLLLQAVSITNNMGIVLKDTAYRAHGFSHWYLRAQPREHGTTTNAGLVVVIAVGLGYLIGQIYDRRAFLLAAWLGVSLAPGVLSVEPAARRMAMMFPAFHAIAGVTIAAIVRLARQRAGKRTAELAGAAAGVGLVGILLTSLASHFTLPMRAVLFGDHVRFARPIIEKSDAIIHNLERAVIMVMVFGSLDRFLESPVGIQHVEPDGWLRASLNPECDFEDAIFGITMPQDRTRLLREAYDPQRITFLFQEEPASRPQIDLVRDLYPAAEVREYRSPRDNRKMVALSIDRADAEALRAPSLYVREVSSVSPAGVLQGLALKPAPATAEQVAGGAKLLIEGGLLIEQPGWYSFTLDPPCAQAEFTIDAQPGEHTELQPVLPGIHPFTLSLQGASACELPLRILARSEEEEKPGPLGAEFFVGETVAHLERARAEPVIADSGYDNPSVIARFEAEPLGLGMDGSGDLVVLVRKPPNWRMRRLSPSGEVRGDLELDIPTSQHISSFAVSPDGTNAVLTGQTLRLYDHEGVLIGSWQYNPFAWESELAWWGNDLILAGMPHQDAISVFDRTGRLKGQLTVFEGGPGKLYHPLALTVSEDGYILVGQLDGQALLFFNEGDEFNPRFVRSFRPGPPLHGGTFQSGDRILLPKPTTIDVFNLHGQQLKAADPSRDLSRLRLGGITRMKSDGNRLYVLGPQGRQLWSIPR